MPENNINKVVYGDRTLIDLTEDTVTEDTLVAGFTAHDRSGASITGTFSETDPTVPSWAKQSTKPSYTASEVGAVATSSVGAASGVAPLNASSKIDESYLPSYVDDVIEGYLYNGSFYKESTYTTVIPGEAGKIYVDLATDKTYRYGGSTFVEISSGTTVSVSRDLTSGTKVGTITVNGTGTDLYAPTPPTAVSQLTNDSGFIVTETDPVYSASAAASITSGNITAWNGKAACHYVTVTESGGTLSADATYQQIATWISNNDVVIVVYEGSNYYYAYSYNQIYYFYDNQGPWIGIDSNGISREEQYYAIGDLSEYVHNEYYDDGVNAIILNDGEDGSHFIRQRYSDNTVAEVFLGNSSYGHTSSIGLTADDVSFDTSRLHIDSNNYTPTYDNDIPTKEYVDDSISSISIPTKTSDLTNDSGFITTETDPTIPSWAKASSKPSYSLSEISGTDDLQSIEGISGTSGLLKKIAANTWSLDTNTYLTSYTETDPTVPSWAKQSSKPTYTPSEVGVHIVTYQINYDEQTEQEEVVLVGATYNDIDTWLGNHEVVILDSRATGKSFYPCGSDRGEYDFGNTDGSRIVLFSNNTGAIYPSSYITEYDVPTYEEDPVFSASPAAGITSSDITSWNGKSSTDEKVTQTASTSDTALRVLLSYEANDTAVTNTVHKSGALHFNPSTRTLTLSSSSTGGSKTATLKYNELKLGNGSNTYQGSYQNGTLTANRTYTFPDKTGTVALTSDIPTVPTTVSSFTNDAGYLTLATLPIYDGTVV